MSVCLSHSAVCGRFAAVGPAGIEISIDCCISMGPQHGAQQQMRVVARLQLTEEVEHRVVYTRF